VTRAARLSRYSAARRLRLGGKRQLGAHRNRPCRSSTSALRLFRGANVDPNSVRAKIVAG
jgi:hypothetical protein